VEELHEKTQRRVRTMRPGEQESWCEGARKFVFKAIHRAEWRNFSCEKFETRNCGRGRSSMLNDEARLAGDARGDVGGSPVSDWFALGQVETLRVEPPRRRAGKAGEDAGRIGQGGERIAPEAKVSASDSVGGDSPLPHRAEKVRRFLWDAQLEGVERL